MLPSISRACPAVFFFALTLSAQQAKHGQASGPIALPSVPSRSEGAGVAPVPPNQLTLDVVVTDKRGQPIADLTQSDFAVLDNGHAATITSFRAVNRAAAPPAEPVKIILLIDEVNTSFQSIAFVRDSVKRFLTQRAETFPHPVTLIFFSDTATEVVQNTSGNSADLIAAIDQHATNLKTIRRSQGFYGAADRFQLSLTNLASIARREESDSGRKLLLWISPGWPYLSGPEITLSGNEQTSLFRSVVALNASLRRAQMTVSSIDPIGANSNVLRSNYYESFLKGIAKASEVEPANLSLQVIATETGGRVLTGSNDSAAQITAAASDADTFYTLILTTPPGEHKDEFHRIQVKLDRANLIARTRTGYYAQP